MPQPHICHLRESGRSRRLFMPKATGNASVVTKVQGAPLPFSEAGCDQVALGKTADQIAADRLIG